MSETFDNPTIMKLPMEIPESLYQLADTMTNAGFEVYIAGGAVRDTILGKTPKDYDISTNASVQDVVKHLGPYVKFAGIQGEKSFEVARLIAYDGSEYEFAPYRIDTGTRKGGEATPAASIREDVERRDLTINALFYKIPTFLERREGVVGEVVDYVGGIDDIKNEVIRTVGDPEKRFGEDRLRILRAFRFAGRVGGEIDQETANAIRNNNSLTEPSDAAVSEERIKDEIIKGIISAKIPSHYIDMLIDFGLFSQILPGLNVSKAISSSKNIAVQFATILKKNDSNNVARILFDRKFGNDIKESVKFLLDILNLNAENLVGLKKELNRIKKSSNKILNDEAIMDFGVIVGQDFNKFLNFASAPPVISARDLIAGGMRPGPELGEAIRDAETKSYFEEPQDVVENISEASSKAVKKLINLSTELNKLGVLYDKRHLNKLTMIADPKKKEMINSLLIKSAKISSERPSAPPTATRGSGSGWASSYLYWDSVPGFQGPVAGYERPDGEQFYFDKQQAPISWSAIVDGRDAAGRGWIGQDGKDLHLNGEGSGSDSSTSHSSEMDIRKGIEGIISGLTDAVSGPFIDSSGKKTYKGDWTSISDSQIFNNVNFKRLKDGSYAGWNQPGIKQKVQEFWRILVWIKTTFPEFKSAPKLVGPQSAAGAVRDAKTHSKILISNWKRAERNRGSGAGLKYFKKWYGRLPWVTPANNMLNKGNESGALSLLTEWHTAAVERREEQNEGKPEMEQSTGHSRGDSIDMGPSHHMVGKMLNEAKKYVTLDVADETGTTQPHYHVGVRHIKSVDHEAAKTSSISSGNLMKKADTSDDKVENPLSVSIPDLSGHVYIFDMDDTLFWTPEWHTIIETGDKGDAVSVDMDFPNMFYKAMDFVKSVNTNHAETIKKDKKGRDNQELIDSYHQEVGSLRLIRKVVDIPLLDKQNQVVFVLSDEGGSPIDIPVLKKYFPSRLLKSFDLRGRYVVGEAVVAGDAVFYQSPKTLGRTPNAEILSLYKAHSGNAIILTARETTEGMEEGIRERLTSVGVSLPLAIITKPSNLSGGKYKGHVIGQIAQQASVDSIDFYDDNLKYVTDVNNILSNIYGQEAHSKVTIHKVSVSNKPEETIFAKLSQVQEVGVLMKLVKIANELDNRGLVKEADRLDRMITDHVDEEKKYAKYTAAFLLPTGSKMLDDWWSSKVKKGFLENHFKHHMTIKFKPSEEEVVSLSIGEDIKLKIIGYASDENGQAVVVSGASSSNDAPHITVSTSKGTSPSYSNELLSKGIIEVDGPELDARIGFWDGNRAVYDFKGSIYED